MGNYANPGANNSDPQISNNPINMENNNNSNIPSNLYKRPTYHNAPSQENNFTKEQKLDKQKAYRDMLYQQVIL